MLAFDLFRLAEIIIAFLSWGWDCVRHKAPVGWVGWVGGLASLLIPYDKRCELSVFYCMLACDVFKRAEFIIGFLNWG
jgi:hypothetical protein